MIENINSKIKKILKIIIGKKNVLKIKFYLEHGYRLNLRNPKYFSEKIQWMKIYGNLEILGRYVDKYSVREYIKRKIGEKYLVPIIDVYESVEELNINSLPESFVIKATHGSGWNLIVKDKQKFDWEKAKETINYWLESNFYEITGENNYKNLKPRFLVEEFLTDPSGDLKDYKFFCFNGKPMFVQVDSNRFGDHRRDIYDIHWNKLKVRYKCDNLEKPLSRPSKLEEMIDVASKLSEDFPFVRVDLYNVNDNIYFGELTFTPENGMRKLEPREFDLKLGELIDLNKFPL